MVEFSLKTSELVGYFAPPDAWIPLILSALRKTSGAYNVVNVLANAVAGTRKSALKNAAPGIVSALMEPEIAW